MHAWSFRLNAIFTYTISIFASLSILNICSVSSDPVPCLCQYLYNVLWVRCAFQGQIQKLSSKILSFNDFQAPGRIVDLKEMFYNLGRTAVKNFLGMEQADFIPKPDSS
jgi:hypothetical protein